VSRKVRVLSVINELYFGGDENRLLTMARTIDQTRFELTVLTLKHAETEVDAHYGTMRHQYAAAGVDVRSLSEGHPNEGLPPNSPLRLMRAGAMFVRTVARVVALIRDLEIDVIDAHLGPGNLVGVVAGVLTGTPRAVTTYHVEAWAPSWLWYVVHQWTLTFSNAIITDSRDCAERIRKWMLWRRPTILVIANGVVVPRSNSSVSELRNRFDLPSQSDVTVVGQISTLLPTKGHMVMLEAASIVHERIPNTAFLLVGFVREDFAYKNRLEDRARELGIAARTRIVSYPGPIGDVWGVIDVHAHPTLLDSLPNAIIEGMSLGRPAVVTSVGGIPSLVEHDVTGLVVPPSDAQALADGLLRLLGDPDLAKRLGDAAHRRYLQAYTPEVMTRRLESLFAELAT